MYKCINVIFFNIKNNPSKDFTEFTWCKKKWVANFIWTRKLLDSFSVLVYLDIGIQYSRHSCKVQIVWDKHVVPFDWYCRCRRAECEVNNSRNLARDEMIINTSYYG